MKNIANDDLIAEVKFRINNTKLDALFSSGQLENLIKDDLYNLYPEVIATERPDRTAEYIIDGRVAILVNGSPYSLIVPALFLDHLSSSEDLYVNNFYANFQKIIRFASLIITLLLPAVYIAITIYHTEFLPSELLFAITAAREKIPFSIIFEIVIMEFAFELIRESGIRVPSALGQTIGIVGALILGEAAVTANIVSPILVIVIATTGISEFAIPDFSLSFSVRLFRIFYLILGYFAGLFGIAAGFFVHLCYLFSTYSFGAPILKYDSANSYHLDYIWKREKRNISLNTKRPDLQPKTSMTWRENKK